MKIYSFLIILSITLAFFSGRIAFMLGNEQLTSKEITYINSLMQELQERVSPTYSVNLREEYPNQSYIELLAPAGLYNTKQAWPTQPTSCFEIIKNRQSLNQFKKEDVWDSFRCHLITSLPENFFQSVPYIHTNGQSYAYMAFMFYPTKFRYSSWFRNHLRYFHISELAELPLDLPAAQQFLVELDSNQLQLMINGSRFFLTNRYLVVNNGFLSFEAFPLKMVDIIFGRSGYSISSVFDSDHCYFRLAHICVHKEKATLVNRLSETSILIFIAAVVILFTTAATLYKKIRKQNLEEERKKHALRVLTHELRTPIASLLLQVENLGQDQKSLPAEVQDKIVRLESDVYRLKHLAEKSRDYLQSDSNQLIQFKSISIDSINSLIESILEELKLGRPKARIEFQPKHDTSVMLDPYWFNLCFTNLIDNAIRYGKQPIRVSTFITEKHIEVSVMDQGQLPHNSLEKLLKKQTEVSQGMGIGLKIVRKTLREMGGDLTLAGPPTTFIMALPFKKG